MYTHKHITTPRLRMFYYEAGRPDAPKLLLLHGNVSSSVFFLPLFAELEKDFHVIAPDLRCFGNSDALPIDARRGYEDWCDDLFAFVKALGWERFALGGWSMGGSITMAYAINHYASLTGLILISPCSPFGFGGTIDEEGTPLSPLGLASGGGCVNGQLIQAIRYGDRAMMFPLLFSVYFRPSFLLGNPWADVLLEGVLQTKVDDKMYPGDVRVANVWPYVAAGDWGVCNTMSPLHGNVSAIVDIPQKPDILWVRGNADLMISDNSLCDLAHLGQANLISGWPGLDVMPPQPMVAQTRYVLNRYAANGGYYRELVLNGGHGCHLESPDTFLSALRALLLN